MLVILYRHGDNYYRRRLDSCEWHVGETLESHFKVNLESSFIYSVQADGDELDWILDHFCNFPTTTFDVQRWFGDLAAQIVWAVANYGGK